MTATVLIVLAGLAVTNLWERRSTAPVAPSPLEDRPVSDQIYLSGVEYRSLQGDVPLFSLSAEEITHRKKKIGAMTINQIKGLDLRGVRIEVYGSAVKRGPLGIGSGTEVSIQQVLREAFADQELGLVSGVTIAGLDLVVSQDGEQRVRLTADLAKLGLDRSEIVFDRPFEVLTAVGQRLMARRGSWDVRRRRLIAAGSYLFIDGDEKAPGSEAEFVLAPDGRISKQ